MAKFQPDLDLHDNDRHAMREVDRKGPSEWERKRIEEYEAKIRLQKYRYKLFSRS